MTDPRRDVAIFDLGGVLIEWDPRHLYRKLFAGDAAAMEDFLATICTNEWNRAQDGGRTCTEATGLLQRRFPHEAERIAAYYARFDEMMPGPIAGSVAILAELRARRTPLYGLTNFSAETYPAAYRRFEFLSWFDGVVVSGEVGALKPERRIFEILCDRFAVDPARAVFIDDSAANAAGARNFGIHGIHFAGPAALRAELAALGML